MLFKHLVCVHRLHKSKHLTVPDKNNSLLFDCRSFYWFTCLPPLLPYELSCPLEVDAKPETKMTNTVSLSLCQMRMKCLNQFTTSWAWMKMNNSVRLILI